MATWLLCGAPPHAPGQGLPPLGSPLKNANTLRTHDDHAQRSYRMFVASSYGLQKACEQSCRNASINGERGMIRCNSAQDHIHLGSRGYAPAGGSGGTVPPDAARVGP